MLLKAAYSKNRLYKNSHYLLYLRSSYFPWISEAQWRETHFLKNQNKTNNPTPKKNQKTKHH